MGRDPLLIEALVKETPVKLDAKNYQGNTPLMQLLKYTYDIQEQEACLRALFSGSQKPDIHVLNYQRESAVDLLLELRKRAVVYKNRKFRKFIDEMLN